MHLTALLALPALLAIQPSANSPMFRFDPGHQGRSGLSGPPQGLAWRLAMGGRVRGTPALLDGTAFLGGEDGILRAIEVQTGRVRWSKRVGSDLSSSPALAGDRVIVLGRDGILHVLRARDGETVWIKPLGRNLPPPQDPRLWDCWVSSPCVSNERVFVGGGDGAIYALDLRTGRTLWTHLTKDRVRSSPAVLDGTVYIGSFDGGVYALDEATGRLKWKVETGGPVQSSPAVEGGVVYVGSRSGFLFALEAGSGKVKWKAPAPDGAWIIGSAALGQGLVVVGCSDGQTLLGFDAATGRERWCLPCRARVLSSPVITGSMVIVGTEDAHLIAVDLGSGLVLGGEYTEGPIMGSAVPAGDRVLAGCDDGFLYAFKATVGTTPSRMPIPSGILGLYEVGPGLPFEVFLQEGRAGVRFGSYPPALLVPTGPDTFSSPLLEVAGRLQRDAAGDVTALVLDFGGQKTIARRRS